MSRTERMGLVAVAIVVLSAAGVLAAEPPKMDTGAQERAARAEQMLAQTREDLTRLERDVARAREVSPEPPWRMLAQLDLARGRAHAAEVAARGLHWRVARPILAEVKRAIGEADRLETLLRTPPPRPPMPVGLAPVGTGSISGTVTDAATGLPLAGVHVKLQATTYPYAGFDAATDAGGDFLFTALGMGVYRLWTRGTVGYLDEVFSDSPCADGECSSSLPTGTLIALEDGQIRAGLDLALQPAASISGTLTGPGGEPVAGAGVYLYDLVDYAYHRDVSTDTAGNFNFGEMSPGTYFLIADHPGYLDELYDNFSCQPDCIPEAGTPITLAPSQVLTGFSVVLTPSGKMAGSVTSAGTGEGVSS
ncbi:MAG: MSCRAMM family protein, partial [Acidobacteriota bacterium]